MDCEHSLCWLNIDTGNTGQRGYASVMTLECDGCEAKFTGPSCVGVITRSAGRDSEQLWSAIIAIGGRRPPVTRPRATEKKDCPHYLGWLRVDDAGAGVRGHTGAIWIYCAGCKTKWNHTVGLGIFLKRFIEDRKHLAAAITGLGGEISG